MKEIVWVFGESAAGKETFIKHIVKDKQTELLEEFGWQNKKAMACNASLRLIGARLSNKREKILDEVSKLLENAEVILIKWQFVDSKTNLPKRLKYKIPDVRQRIISLKVSPEELAERLPAKPLWSKYGKTGEETKLVAHDLQVVRKSLQELSDFDTTTINSSKSGNYEIIRNK